MGGRFAGAGFEKISASVQGELAGALDQFRRTEFASLRALRRKAASGSLPCRLLPELQAMRAMGVDVVRISPQSRHTLDIVNLFHNVMTQRTPVDMALQSLQALLLEKTCNGYWYGKPGLEHTSPESEHA